MDHGDQPRALHIPHVQRSFFERDARVVARAMIGMRLLVRDKPAGADAGVRLVRNVRIVETEAYRGPDDAACHARFGLTKRTRTLFGPPGHAYVFLIYGMYDCFNVTCAALGRGHAVLVRAVEPISGVAPAVRTDGPGRVTRALAITRSHDGVDLCDDGTLVLLAREKVPRIATSARVGVGYAGDHAEELWRFFDPTSAHVSRPSAKTIGLGRRA